MRPLVVAANLNGLQKLNFTEELQNLKNLLQRSYNISHKINKFKQVMPMS